MSGSANRLVDRWLNTALVRATDILGSLYGSLFEIGNSFFSLRLAAIFATFRKE